MGSRRLIKLIILGALTTAFFALAKEAKAAVFSTNINSDQLFTNSAPFSMLGTDGYPRLVYYTGQLIYVKCQSQSCDISTRTVLNTGSGAIVNGNVAAYKVSGGSTSGHIKIFYVNNDAGTYKIRKITCSDDVCSSPIDLTYIFPTTNMVVGFNRFAAVDSATGATHQPRLLLGWQDNSTTPPTQRIYFFNCASDCSTPGQTAPPSLSVQSATTVWQNLSLTVSSTNLPLITYWEVTSSSVANLKFYQCTNAGCSTKAASSPLTLSTKSVASLLVGQTSITTTSGGFPAIVYSWKPGALAPNTQVAICVNIACSSGTVLYSSLVNDSNPKILRLPSGNLRVFSTRNPGATSSLKMNQCNSTCSGAWTEISIENNDGADWAGPLVGSDNTPWVVYNANPGGLGTVLRMTCNLEGGSACDPSFSISVVPGSAEVEQGQNATYNVTLVPLNGFSTSPGSVALSKIDNTNPSPGTINPSFNSSSIILTAGTPASTLLRLQPSLTPAVPNGTYLVAVRGVFGALTKTSSNFMLIVDLVSPKPWLKASKGDVISKGDGLALESISFDQASPSTNVSHVIVANFGVNNFSSAKSWLVENYPGGVNDSVLNAQYDYLWSKLAGGSVPDWTPTCSNDTTIVGGLPSSSCILLNTNNTGPGYGGVMANNGVFKYKNPGGKPDLLYNIQATYNGTRGYYEGNWNGDYDGKDLPISGNPTVIFVPGKLQINRPILTSGNKKLIFVVQGDVEINPTVKTIDASVITNGVFKDFVWLNSRNQTRYNNLLAIEAQLKKFHSYVNYYPFHRETDTSEGCSTLAPYPGEGWWWETWHKDGDPSQPHGNATGNGTWDGTNPFTGASNFQYDPCPATPPAATPRAGLRWHLSVRTDLPASYYSPPFELNNYLDPINGKNCGSAPYTNCFGKNIATPKAYAYRYWSWWPGDVYCFDPAEPTYNSVYGFFNTCATAYELSFNVEDDGYLDRYSKIEGTLYTLCNGDYNRPLDGNFIESRTGGYSCDYWPLELNGAVMAQGGFSLQRDLRDDNGSIYTDEHPPAAAELFNFDPSIYYYFAQDVPGSGPLFAIKKTYAWEAAP